MKILSDKQILEYSIKKQEEKEFAIKEEYSNLQKQKELQNEATLNEYKNSNKRINEYNNFAKFKSSVKSELLEAGLDLIFDKCFGSSSALLSDEDKSFNSTIVSNFIFEEGVENLLDTFSSKTQLLSELSYYINETVEDALQDIDIDNSDTQVVDSELKEDLLDNINGDETIDDITDVIRSRVSQATEDFIQKNIVDNIDIKDAMYATKQKLDNIKTGDDTLDQEIAKEQTLATKRIIRKITNRPHSVFEQMVINLTESILGEEKLKDSFALESGKLDMDKIVKRSTSYYTFLEMTKALKIKDVNENYIKEALNMK